MSWHLPICHCSAKFPLLSLMLYSVCFLLISNERHHPPPQKGLHSSGEWFELCVVITQGPLKLAVEIASSHQHNNVAHLGHEKLTVWNRHFWWCAEADDHWNSVCVNEAHSSWPPRKKGHSAIPKIRAGPSMSSTPRQEWSPAKELWWNCTRRQKRMAKWQSFTLYMHGSQNGYQSSLLC